LLCGAALLSAGPLASAAAAAAPDCSDLDPPLVVDAPVREPTAEDLIRLRDTGNLGTALAGAPPMRVSPDGRRFAFHLRRASLAEDRHCAGMFVMDVRPGARPIRIDTGGELIFDNFSIAGLEEMPSGAPRAITPRWSPDGKWIAYLRRDAGSSQVWVAPSGGGGAASPATRSAADVEDFAWLPDGAGLVFTTRPGLRPDPEKQARERDEGAVYDRRFFPPGSSRPMPVGPIPVVFSTVDRRTGALRAARPEEEGLLEGRTGGKPRVSALNGRGDKAWTELADSAQFGSATKLRVEVAGKELACRYEVCGDSVQGLWWVPGETLMILRTEGANNDTLVMYRWRPGSGPPRALLRTTERLISCQLTDQAALLCAHEASTVPRRFVLFDTRTGAMRPLLDLNPEFQAIRLAPARRISWKNAYGIEAHGDLVLPPAHRPGQVHPLLVTQYTSTGFLRGGTGDEYPIQLFARRGFAVLSFHRPSKDPVPIAARNVEEYYAVYQKDWLGRRNIVSSLEQGIRAVVELGVADPARVGITGFSDGATTAWFALINTRLFAAAALSTCCEEPSWAMGLAGPAYAAMIRRIGYQLPGEAGFEAFWRPYSLAMNAKSVRVPLLIQTGDWEFRLATETYGALEAAGRPVEMIVFPGEAHLKVGPRHRAAVYERNLDWFDYWLRGLKDPAPAKVEQYRRWDALPRP
jgi:dipeptidyl aminopeptidase/acylaminoacyl peptidase